MTDPNTIVRPNECPNCPGERHWPHDCKVPGSVEAFKNINASLAMDELVERLAQVLGTLLTRDHETRVNLVRAIIEADDSALAKENMLLREECRAEKYRREALAKENKRLLRMISCMENEDPELVERWRANTKDKPHE